MKATLKATLIDALSGLILTLSMLVCMFIGYLLQGNPGVIVGALVGYSVGEFLSTAFRKGWR